MKNLFLMYVALAASALVFAACSDNDDNPVTPQDNEKRYVLVEERVTYSDSGTEWQTYYSYDDQGRLIKELFQEQIPGEGEYEEVTEFSYEGGLIKEKKSDKEETNILHLNAEGMLTDYEFYNYAANDFLHYTYEYDDDQQLKCTHNADGATQTATWEDGELVKLEIAKNGVTSTVITIEPSTVETPDGFYLMDMLSSIAQNFIILGVYGKQPKHLPGKLTMVSQASMGSSVITFDYSYTVAGGLLTGCDILRVAELNLPPVVQNVSYHVNYVFSWKELE